MKNDRNPCSTFCKTVFLFIFADFWLYSAPSGVQTSNSPRHQKGESFSGISVYHNKATVKCVSAVQYEYTTKKFFWLSENYVSTYRNIKSSNFEKNEDQEEVLFAKVGQLFNFFISSGIF